MEAGTVEVDFETAWGSNKSDNPFEEGTITRLLADGGEESAEGFGVIAGPAGPDEQLLLPGVGELASIAVLGFEDGGSLVGMTLVMPASLLGQGATLVIGRDTIEGGIWAIAPGATEPLFFLPFTEGTLTLLQAGAEPGEAIAGSFSGAFGNTPEAAPSRTYTYSGEDLSLATLDVELSFFTTFGSLDGPDSIAEGSVIEYRVNGTDIPIGESGAIAGLADPHEAEDLGLEEAALITLVLPLPDGTTSVSGVWLPPVLLESGASLTIGEGRGRRVQLEGVAALRDGLG